MVANMMMSINEIAAKLGLKPETIRIWERRYGFPDPGRDARGNRQYSPELLVQLRLIKDLLDMGYRAGRVVRLGMDELMLLNNKVSAAHASQAPQHQEFLQLCVALIKEQGGAKLRALLKGQLARLGVRDFVVDVGAPLASLVRVGCKASGFTVGEGYVFTTVLEPLMREAVLASAEAMPGGPKVLLATPPHDRSLVDLLFVQALLTLEGAVCVPVGCIKNFSKLVMRTRGERADFVVMCCSPQLSPRSVVENARRLQGELGENVAVSLGHLGDASVKRRIGDASILELKYVGEFVATWRASHPPMAAGHTTLSQDGIARPE